MLRCSATLEREEPDPITTNENAQQPPNYIPPDFMSTLTPTPAHDAFFERQWLNPQPITVESGTTLGTIEGRKLERPQRGKR